MAKAVDVLIGALDALDQATDQKLSHVLKKKGGPLESIKEELRAARKPKMRTVAHFLCDGCDATILDPDEGFIIHGNIYRADPVNHLGIIGNNFPEKPEGLKVEDVKKTVLCRRCFMKAIGTTKRPVPKKPKDSWRNSNDSYDVIAGGLQDVFHEAFGNTRNEAPGDEIPF